MSAIAAVLFARDWRAPAEARRMVAAMAGRGGAACRVWEGEGGEAAVAVGRDAWQARPGLGGETLVAVRDGVTVVADAALYYRGELRRLIGARGIAAAGDDPAELIAAAYVALGPAFVERLEGDFAFVLWDADRRQLLCARDFGGRRPLYYAEVDGSVVVASTVGGVLAHSGCPAALNLTSLAETAAGFLGATSETCYAAIRRLPPGHTLVATTGRSPVVEQYWEPPTFERPSGVPFEEAALELRALLERAVAERLAPSATTAVSMSGGWDSPPIFAAGRSALARGLAPGASLVPVSMSYPPGDVGREDEIIERIAAHWGEQPRWRSVDDVPLFGAPAARAAARDEPLAHVYELWNQALMQGARDAGAHVALDGIGGDALFQISPVYLADLLARGRWAALRREWRAEPLRAGGWRAFARWAVAPVLPAPARWAVRRLRGGRSLRDYLWREPPPWLRASFVREHALAARGGVAMRRRRGETRAALESRWHFTAPWAPSLLGALGDVAAGMELELRSPYYDRRVIAFAATRPREERRGGGETKRLVRASMKGILPDDVLAPRATRTGITSGYFARRVRAELPALLATDFESVALADLGIVDADALRSAAAALVRDPGSAAGPALWFTLQTEWWVRARLGLPAAAPMLDPSDGSAAAR